MKIKNMKKIAVVLGFLLPSIIFSSIVDNEYARLTEAQKAWLLDNQDIAMKLYINELGYSQSKEIPAYNLAYIHFRRNEFDEALGYLDIAVKNNPKYGPAYLLKARIEHDNPEYKGDAQDFELALKYHPRQELAEYYYGIYFYKKGDYKYALKHLLEAISEWKLYTPPYSLIADIYLKNNEIEDAIEILEKGLVQSYDAEILLMLAYAYEKNNDWKSAEKYYGLFTHLFPYHGKYDEVSQWLKKNGVAEVFTNNFTQSPERDKSDWFFSTDEEILYNVAWGPLRIGELYLAVADTLTLNGKKAYLTHFCMDSNPALAFIATLHSDYVSIIDRSTKRVIRHFLHQRENDIIAEKVYNFYRDKGLFTCHIVEEDGHIRYLEKYMSKNTIDGTSLLFYARQLVKEKRFERLLTVIDENFVITDINPTNTTQKVDIREKEENAFLIKGENFYKGIVGFTGRFRGWFRDAPTYLPVRSDFEIWIGRISVDMATEEALKLREYKM